MLATKPIETISVCMGVAYCHHCFVVFVEWVEGRMSESVLFCFWYFLVPLGLFSIGVATGALHRFLDDWEAACHLAAAFYMLGTIACYVVLGTFMRIEFLLWYIFLLPSCIALFAVGAALMVEQFLDFKSDSAECDGRSEPAVEDEVDEGWRTDTSPCC
ncbi:hypothetical protein BDV95DRAFT_318048 [Massariosphaeria phaeospora]|uniref:Transmembrane protein n=1 Tax=Massariosphaeria phaeospora TaxID=100035 RepID=A0A7C8ICZ6_9PLEO|nr:hypothetical protein BDV95DRAFT_318048 [Massariosphaeria phaeospora]